MVKIIIQARMLSSRLRGKSLMAVAGKPLLVRVLESARQLEFADEILVATTIMASDDPIDAMCKRLGVSCFRGNPFDVLARFNDATSDMSASDTVVRWTADNPLLHARAANEAHKIFQEEQCDYLHIHDLSHVVPEFIRVAALRDAHHHARTSFDKEHVTPYLRRNHRDYKVKELPDTFGGLRPELDHLLTIDEYSQLTFIEKVYEELGGAWRDIEKVYQTAASLEKGLGPEELHPIITLDLDGTIVGDKYPPYIIAEIGQNHNGEIKLAKQLIDMAARSGANAVKFQKRDIDSELTEEAFNKPYDNPNSFGRTYGEHRIFLELTEDEHAELKAYANARNITYFCTPCDIPSVEAMERIECPFYKVASRDLTNIPLLERLAKTGKPVILSTGMADLEDIDDALRALNPPKDKCAILQCTSEYPCKLENVNLQAMETLKEKYGYIVGFSDHTSGIIVSAAASVLGAKIIEKHITLDRTMKGTDHPGSLEEAGLKKLIQYIQAINAALGDGVKAFNPVVETAKLKLSRSLTSTVGIKKGDILREDMLCLKSPGTGLKWREKDRILGKKALRDIDKNTTIMEADFE